MSSQDRGINGWTDDSEILAALQEGSDRFLESSDLEI